MVKSDLHIVAEKLNPKSISAETERFNNDLIQIMKGGPRWWEVREETSLSA